MFATNKFNVINENTKTNDIKNGYANKVPQPLKPIYKNSSYDSILIHAISGDYYVNVSYNTIHHFSPVETLTKVINAPQKF